MSKAKKFTGTVVSDAQRKTCVVALSRQVTHPVYGKRYIISKRVQAHDEGNQAKKGDQVEIIETRPVSKHKSFRMERVLEKSHGEVELKQEPALEERES